jgi:hypothetical protein
MIFDGRYLSTTPLAERELSPQVGTDVVVTIGSGAFDFAVLG